MASAYLTICPTLHVVKCSFSLNLVTFHILTLVPLSTIYQLKLSFLAKIATCFRKFSNSSGRSESGKSPIYYLSQCFTLISTLNSQRACIASLIIKINKVTERRIKISWYVYYLFPSWTKIANDSSLSHFKAQNLSIDAK